MVDSKMILLDYGDTLVREAPFDGLKGTQAVLNHAAVNKNNLSAEDVLGFSAELHKITYTPTRAHGLEIMNQQFQKLLYELLEISFDLPPLTLEEIFWDSAAPGEATPQAAVFLGHLRKKGIRTGVLSNISFSSKALTNRLSSIFPDHLFEFALASSDYLLRKPNARLFQIGLKKASLAPEEVWYCGDSLAYDVLGAAEAGLFPVWYCPNGVPAERPAVPHLVIGSWQELMAWIT